MSTKVVKLTVINDFVCGFSYIGHFELLEAIDHCKDVLNLPLSFEIEYRPFKLLQCVPDDQPLEKTTSKKDFFKEKIGCEGFSNTQAKILKWFEDKGLPTNAIFDAPVCQSTQAHRLSRKAYLMGGQRYQEPLLSAIFKEHFENGKNYADPDVLSDIAEDVGMMTKDDALAFLESEELRDEVVQMAQKARDKGITGVPVTIIGSKWAVNGAQCADSFIQIFKKIATCNGKSSTDCSSASSPMPAALVEATFA